MKVIFDTLGQEWIVVNNHGDKVTHLVFLFRSDAWAWVREQLK